MKILFVICIIGIIVCFYSLVHEEIKYTNIAFDNKYKENIEKSDKK